MVFSRNDLELLHIGGWEVCVTNGMTTIKKDDGKLIDDQTEIMRVVETERFEQKSSADKIFAQYFGFMLFVFFGLAFVSSRFN